MTVFEAKQFRKDISIKHFIKDSERKKSNVEGKKKNDIIIMYQGIDMENVEYSIKEIPIQFLENFRYTFMSHKVNHYSFLFFLNKNAWKGEGLRMG